MAEREDDEFVLVREMCRNEADLAHWLPGATRHAAMRTLETANGRMYTIDVGHGRIEITAVATASGRIASIALPVPVPQARFRFPGMPLQQRDDFLAYFDHYTRRSGG